MVDSQITQAGNTMKNSEISALTKSIINKELKKDGIFSQKFVNNTNRLTRSQ